MSTATIDPATTDDGMCTSDGGEGRDAFDACLTRMRAALAEVADVPAWTLTEEQVQDRFRRVLQVRAQVEELTARLLASVVDREVPRLEGCSSSRAWLSGAHGMSGSDAARLVAESQVHDGDGLAGRCAVTRAAWAAGRLPAERAVLAADAVTRLGADVAIVDVDRLQVDLARESAALSFRQYQILCRHAVEVIDPDAVDARLEQQLLEEEARALDLTQLSVRRLGDGTSRLSGRIPNLAADMLKAALEAIASPRRTDVGCDNGAPTYPQRVGRAFVQLLEHLPTTKLPQHGVGNASIVVTVGLDQLKAGAGEAMLDTGTPVSVGQLRRLACNAAIIPAVLDSAGQMLDLGRSQRLFSRAQRVALAVRDSGCVFPGCDRPPSWCEAHHVTSWLDDGPTDLANGCLLCSWHHHLVHQGEWRLQIGPDQVTEVIPPPRIDATGTPRRHERFRRRRC